MDIQSLCQTIIDRLKASVSINDVYGAPIVVGDKTIIPVASVAYGFGAGGGEGTMKSKGEEGEDNEPGTGSGMGGGGYARAKPVAVLEITEGGTRVIPVIDFSKVAMLGLAGAIIIAVLRHRR